jgi:hypothetical protein
VRTIDDFTASLINHAVASGEKLRHEGLDTLVALIQREVKSRCGVLMRKDDFVGAFKTLPLRKKDLDLAIAVTKLATGEVRALQLWCCPFGAVASVHAWHRVGAALQQVLAKLFLVAYARYVDDMLGADAKRHMCIAENGLIDMSTPEGTADLARWVLHVLLGWTSTATRRSLSLLL